MKYGMTGTRNDLTDRQMEWFFEQLKKAESLDHGACVGADEFAHDCAILLGKPITVHPPTKQKWMMPAEKWYVPGADITVLEPLPFLARNVNIVDRTDYLLAAPDGSYRPRSGTWHTINYAISLGRPGLICYPEGTVVPL